MFKHLSEGLVLVTDEKGFEELLDDVIPVTSSVMTDFNRAARPHIKRPTEYPVLVTRSLNHGMQYTPVSLINKLIEEVS